MSIFRSHKKIDLLDLKLLNMLSILLLKISKFELGVLYMQVTMAFLCFFIISSTVMHSNTPSKAIDIFLIDTDNRCFLVYIAMIPPLVPLTV